jgi:hypothetical protein
MYPDNQAAVAPAHGQGDYRRAKHIDIRCHFIQHHLKRGTLDIAYIPSEHQLADFVTKAFPAAKYNAGFRGQIGKNPLMGTSPMIAKSTGICLSLNDLWIWVSQQLDIFVFEEGI